MKLSALFLIIVAICLCGCKDNGGVMGPGIPSEPGVYVVGTSNVKGLTQGVFWKDGAITALTNSDILSRAYCISVSGGDVVIGGSVSGEKSLGLVPAYWKNGVVHRLPAEIEESTVYGIAAANGHIYSCGSENYGVSAWIDNIQTISRPFENSGPWHSIAVENGNVFIAGTDESHSYGYLKNGKLVKIGVTAPFAPLYIAASGNDVYLLGIETNEQTHDSHWAYWKNGLLVSFDPGLNVSAMAVDGSDVYFAGSNEKREISFWKNSVKTDLGVVGYVSGIAVKGNDVYIVGQSGDGYAPGYWKNGVWNELSGLPGSQENTAHGIVVK